MRVYQEPERDYGRNALTFALGAVGGIAIGVLLSRRGLPVGKEQIERFGTGIRQQAQRVGTRARAVGEQARGLVGEQARGLGERARGLGEHARDLGEHARNTVARRLRPARMERPTLEQTELSILEDRVIDAFVADSIVGERGIDIGAISPGIIELSGSVRTEEESERAVRIANGVSGVKTVVNRIEVGGTSRGPKRAATASEAGGNEWTGRNVGMNQRRQGRSIPKRTDDDSQAQVEKALRDADLAQYGEVTNEQSMGGPRPGIADPWQVNFDEDELDNQDPHGKNAAYTLDEQPQEYNTSSRVGEGLKPGEHLAFEQADFPLKPHGGTHSGGEGADESSN